MWVLQFLWRRLMAYVENNNCHNLRFCIVFKPWTKTLRSSSGFWNYYFSILFGLLQRHHNWVLLTTVPYIYTTYLFIANAVCTSYLIDILKWQSQWLVRRTFWWVDAVKGVHDRHAAVLLLVGLRYLPALEPRHLWTGIKHVVPVPAGYRHECNWVWIVSNLLDVRRDFLLDLIVPRLKRTKVCNDLQNSCLNTIKGKR